MASPSRVCAVVFVLLLLGACHSDLINIGPTPADEGIVIFLHADFLGASQALNVDVRDLTKLQGPCSGGSEGEVPSWGKCVSSVRVLPGWSAVLYKDEDFKGTSITLTADTPNLQNIPGPCDHNFNDCVTSIRVTRQ